jgi:transposase-like protein
MKYSKKIVERICELIRTDSYTIAEICRQAGISVETFYEWKRTKPDFSECIKKAQCEFDEFIVSEAHKSLVKLIRGYTVQEQKTVTAETGKLDENGAPVVRVKEHTVTDKHYQPVTAAVIFALTNRDGERWKNRMNNELTGKGGKDLFEGFNPADISDEERRSLLSVAEKYDTGGGQS